MIRSDERWLSLVDSFHAAALGEQRWDVALQGLADATGSRSGQLFRAAADASVGLNILTNMDPAGARVFAESGGGDPSINPRVKAGSAARLLEAIAESDFITHEEWRKNDFVRDVLHPWDVPFSCVTILERQNGAQTALAVLRSSEEGHIRPEERELFSSLSPHVRAAVRAQDALEGQGAQLLAGALETLSVALFVCDHRGTVRTLTPTAEILVTGRCGLQLVNGQLGASRPAEAKALSQAIEAAAATRVKPGPPCLRTVIVRGPEPDAAPVVLDVFALPPRHRFDLLSFTPRVLIVARGSRAAHDRRGAVLSAAYGLTPAETDVALRVAEGKTVGAIAKARAVAVGTVHAQIKTILSKVGVNRQAELAARLSHL
jgi:DNA-binding CsgD family transcriptional regulator